MTVQPGSDLRNDCRRRDATACRVLDQAGYLTVKIVLLIRLRYPSVKGDARGLIDRLLDENGTGPELDRTRGQVSRVEPASRRLATHAIPSRPLGQFHVSILHCGYDTLPRLGQLRSFLGAVGNLAIPDHKNRVLR